MDLRWHAHHERDLPDDLGWLSPGEALRAAEMRFAKRRTDYLLGRHTAKCAVATRLGLSRDPATFARIEVANRESGEPELLLDDAPAPLALSLTTRSGWAVCASSDAGILVGCDLERVEPRSDAFVADYLTSAEQQEVARATSGDARDELCNLIWSAKESALKVLGTGLRRDTRGVEVTVRRGDADSGWRPLAIDLVEGRRLPGWWRRLGDFVLTVVAGEEAPPPRAIGERDVLQFSESAPEGGEGAAASPP